MWWQECIQSKVQEGGSSSYGGENTQTELKKESDREILEVLFGGVDGIHLIQQGCHLDALPGQRRQVVLGTGGDGGMFG